MRDMMWIYAVMIFLVTESRSQLPDTRNLAFNLGSDINLTCSDKTWNDALYVIWSIELKHKNCKIAFSHNGEASEDSCNDGKSLRNTSMSQSYLHIPNFSAEDVGLYKCEQAVRAGMETYRINVDITVYPNISAWLEVSDNTMVAVCKAESGKPAANITWSHMGNNAASVKELPHSDGSITVESHLKLTEDMDTKNLTCIIRHLFWKKPKILNLQLKHTNMGNFLLLTIPIVVVVTAFLVGFAFFARKKLLMLRQCQPSDVSQSKAPPVENVEEVEPYASYVQRVNSIYN
ncbi:hypothetical protein INR49_021935 [Caranx melampygus]|nr:hypothetical protein INR49_021935 [Caranx melampygus]